MMKRQPSVRSSLGASHRLPKVVTLRDVTLPHGTVPKVRAVYVGQDDNGNSIYRRTDGLTADTIIVR
jgi:hypothetical protein